MSQVSNTSKTIPRPQLDERTKTVVDFFALLFRIDQRIKKSKEAACSTPSAKSK